MRNNSNLDIFIGILVSEKTTVTLHFRLNVIASFSYSYWTKRWHHYDVTLLTGRNIIHNSNVPTVAKVHKSYKLLEHHAFRNLHILIIKRHGYKRVKSFFADRMRVTSLTGSQGCELFSPKQENGQNWKVNSIFFFSTLNELKNFNPSFGNISKVSFVKVFCLTMSLLLILFCENILFLK